jgi:hypothetical protein
MENPSHLNPLPLMSNFTEDYVAVLEDLMDDDPFIRLYPTFKAYIRAWDEMGGEAATRVSENFVFEFYAEKVLPEDALHTWYTYDPLTQLQSCKQ